MIYYSPKKNGFYPLDMKEDYGDSWPADAVAVSDEEWAAYGQTSAPAGYVRGWIDDSLAWVKDESVRSPEEIAAEERSWRNHELFRADVELNKVQDSDPKATGTVTVWRDYRKQLRAWPENKDFPNKEKRPQAPDATN